MDTLILISRLHEHRAWVNRQLLHAAEGLGDEQLRRQFAIGQGSVWNSLAHMYAAEYVWLDTMLGNPNATLPGDLPGKLPGNQEGPGAIASLGELVEKWEALESRWQRYLESLPAEALDATLYKVSTSSARGKKLATSRADILVHVCTHAQYTAAQVVNMLRHLGVRELPDVMLISLARSQHPENA